MKMLDSAKQERRTEAGETVGKLTTLETEKSEKNKTHLTS